MLAKFEKVRNDIWAGKYNNPGYLPHWHIDHEIIHCEKGRIYVTLNGQAIVLEPGDSIYFYSSGSDEYLQQGYMIQIPLSEDAEPIIMWKEERILK